MDEVIAKASAAAAAPRATIKAYFLQASLREHISRLVAFLLTATLPVLWLLLSSRECIFLAGSSRPPGLVGMID